MLPILLRDACGVLGEDPREGVVMVGDFFGQVIGSVAGQFEGVLITMRAGAGACWGVLEIVASAVVWMARG